MQTPKEKVLERIISRLKDNVVHSEEFLQTDASDQVNKKIDNVAQHVHSILAKNSSDYDLKASLTSLLDGLENVRDTCNYYMKAATRAANDYNTYLYVLEALYNEYNGGIPEPEVKETRSEKKSASEEQQSQPQPQPQPQPKPKEVVAVAKTKEEKHQEKSGRFKFSFP
jgi:hypothetical protein